MTDKITNKVFVVNRNSNSIYNIKQYVWSNIIIGSFDV